MKLSGNRFSLTVFTGPHQDPRFETSLTRMVKRRKIVIKQFGLLIAPAVRITPFRKLWNDYYKLDLLATIHKSIRKVLQ